MQNQQLGSIKNSNNIIPGPKKMDIKIFQNISETKKVNIHEVQKEQILTEYLGAIS